MNSIGLPVVASQPYDVVIDEVAAVHRRSPIVGFTIGDNHLWARKGTNNAKQISRLVSDIEALGEDSTLPYWLTIGDTWDSKRAHRRSADDLAVEVRMQAYAQVRRLCVLTGNHDHRVIAHPLDIMRTQHARANKKRGIESDLSWMQGMQLPDCTVLAVANDEVFVGPAAAALGFGSRQTVTSVLTRLPPYADLVVVRFAEVLYLLRHGDKYDGWWHRNPRLRDSPPKWFVNKVAHLGSHTYDGIGWLRRVLEKYFASQIRSDAENRIKRWYNEQLRDVCTTIPTELSREARELEVLLGHPISATLAGHTHTPLRGVFGTHEHVNVEHARSEVGFAVWTANGVLHGPFVIGQS